MQALNVTSPGGMPIQNHYYIKKNGHHQNQQIRNEYHYQPHLNQHQQPIYYNNIPYYPFQPYNIPSPYTLYPQQPNYIPGYVYTPLPHHPYTSPSQQQQQHLQYPQLPLHHQPTLASSPTITINSITTTPTSTSPSSSSSSDNQHQQSDDHQHHHHHQENNTYHLQNTGYHHPTTMIHYSPHYPPPHHHPPSSSIGAIPLQPSTSPILSNNES
ncbi:unnamed protein product [Cunninghamella blakesleeana]